MATEGKNVSTLKRAPTVWHAKFSKVIAAKKGLHKTQHKNTQGCQPSYLFVSF
jgi:hypothetical protein